MVVHYLAGGEGGTTIQNSQNGIDFIPCKGVFNEKCNKIVCFPDDDPNKNISVAVGKDTGGRSIIYSYSGIEWYSCKVDGNIVNVNEVKDLVYDHNNGVWVAMSVNAEFYISKDGKTWTTASSLGEFSYFKDNGFTQGESLTVVNDSIWALGTGTTPIIKVTIADNYFDGTSLDINIQPADGITKLKFFKNSNKFIACGTTPKIYTNDEFDEFSPRTKTILSDASQTGIFSVHSISVRNVDKIIIGCDNKVFFALPRNNMAFETRDQELDIINHTLTNCNKINDITFDLTNKITFLGISSTGPRESSIQYYNDIKKQFLRIRFGGFTTGCYTITTRTSPKPEVDNVTEVFTEIGNTSDNNNTSTETVPSLPSPVKTVSNKTQRAPPIEMLPAPKKSSGRSVKVRNTRII